MTGADMPVTLKEHLKSITVEPCFVQGAFCKIPYMTKPSYIYFMQSEDFYIKIGCTRNIKSRIKAVQAHNPMKIKLIGKMKGGYDLEVKIHRRFKKHRTRGEWFEGSPELLEYIATHKIYKGKPLG